METNCTDNQPNIFAKNIPLLPGKHGEILGKLEVGWRGEKWRAGLSWSTQAAISLKHIKIDEKLLWRAYRKSQTLFRTVPSPNLYGHSFP